MKHERELKQEALERVAVVRRASWSRRVLTIFIPLAILALGAAVAAYLIATRPEVAAKPIVEKIWTVAATPATVTDVQPEIRFYGRIVAARQIEIRPEVSGRVVEIGPNFVEGGLVRKGDLLVRVDDFDYQARLREIQADLKGTRGMLERDAERIDLLRRDVERRNKLQVKGHTSEKALDDAKLALSDAIQQKIDRENKAERLEVDLTRVQRDLRDTNVTAPFNGFLVDVTTGVGKFVNVGDTIAKAIRADRLEARFHVSNAAFTQFLSDGNYRNVKAKVLWAGQSYDAALDRIESQVETASGGVEVFARIDGVTVDTNLRPGAFVEVLVPGPVFKSVVRIPEEALYGNDTVYRVVQNRLEPHKVEVIARDGKDLLVRGNFEADDRVVTTRFPEIGPGLKVQVP